MTTQRPRLPRPYEGQPVTVVGAGPVGQSTALLLARWGIAVRLLDGRGGRERIGSRSICQHRDVLDIWDAVGAGGSIAAEGVTWRTARTFYREQELARVELSDPGRSPFPAFVNISQTRTEEILDTLVAADPLVTMHWGHEVTGIDQDGGGVALTCRTPDGPELVRSPYAVVCAGGHGDALRQALGVRFEGATFEDEFLICDIRADLPGHEPGHGLERRFYFDPPWNPGRQVLIHPCPGGTYRIDWQVPPGFDLEREMADGGLDARVRAIAGEAPYEILWYSVYRFHARVADRFRSGRVLLAGDVAHLVAPFGARGLNSGVADAENAAWKVAFVLHGWAGESLLESYHDERHAAAVGNLDVTSATMRFLVPQDEEQRAYRTSTLEAALHDEAARSRVDSGTLYEPFAYTDSPLTTPGTSRSGSPGPGVLVPDIGVRLPDGREGHLRQLVRDGLLALACTRLDTSRIAATLSGAVAAPVRLLHVDDLDPGGQLAAVLGAREGELWLLRPDGHVAAVLETTDVRGVADAARRALGMPGSTTRAEDDEGGST